jgi:hypothetical protein
MRLVRNQPQPLLESQLKAYYDELNDLQDQGILQVREGALDGPAHVFREEGLKWKLACAEARVEFARAVAQLRREGRHDEAKELVMKLPEEPKGVFDFDEGLSMPATPPGEVVHEPSQEEAPAEESTAGASGAEEGGAGDEGGDEAEEGEVIVPDMTWTKAQLVEHAARVLPADPVELDEMTKRQILQKLEG